MHFVAFFLGLLPLLANASPITVRAGAGGPTPKPIPSNCTITNPLSHANCTTTTTISGFRPASNFISAHKLYESYFDLPTAADELWEQCSQQCYGYGEEGECKSAIMGYDVPTPKGYYGGSGGELMIACLLFDAYLTSSDIENAVEGEWRDVRAGSLYCGH